MQVPINNIPTFDFNSREWSKTSFTSQKEFAEYLIEHCFKEPGEYNFDANVFEWNKQATTFNREGSYTQYAPGTNEYNEFWDEEKLRSRLGVLWVNKKENKIWYTPRDYYFLLNYCPIANKETGKDSFMTIRDVQYHMMIYEKIAELLHKHSVILKKRQMAYSVCHTAKCLNFLWFENKKTIKIFASNEGYLNTVNGCWKMIDVYRNHLNQHTDWERVFSPGEYPNLKQIEKTQNRTTKLWTTIGNESTLNAKPLDKDVAKSVGGAGLFFWHEEGGVAPKADEALMYIDPALEVTSETRSGSFCIGGSVGDLDQCKPLESFMTNPTIWNFYPVRSKWISDDGVPKEAGLFIPTQYGMPEATDEFGNSQVEKGLSILSKMEEDWKKLPPDKYAIKKSQNPKTMNEAFAWRKTAYFNTQRIARRQAAIKIKQEDGSFFEAQGLMEISKEGKVRLKSIKEFSDLDRPTPMEYPVDPKILDKRGVVRVWEEPDEDADGSTYFAGVDSVEVGPSETSDSLFSVHIYKRGTRTMHTNKLGEQILSYNRGRLVATYTGRFKNPEDHNEQGLLLLRWYKALAACERNRPNFINYCRRKGFDYLIARKSQLPFDKDIDAIGSRNDEFGINADSLGKLLDREKKATYEYIDAEIDTVHMQTDDDSIGKVVKTLRGYDLVDDYWLLEEWKLWNEDRNADRFVSASLAIILGVSREIDHDKTIYTQEKPDREAPVQRKQLQSLLGGYKPQQKSLLKR